MHSLFFSVGISVMNGGKTDFVENISQSSTKRKKRKVPYYGNEFCAVDLYLRWQKGKTGIRVVDLTVRHCTAC